MTKWEQFARERGIGPKSKRSRKVLDEATGEWKYLTGSVENKANAGPESWPIIEVKKNDDPMQGRFCFQRWSLPSAALANFYIRCRPIRSMGAHP